MKAIQALDVAGQVSVLESTPSTLPAHRSISAITFAMTMLHIVSFVTAILYHVFPTLSVVHGDYRRRDGNYRAIQFLNFV